MTRCHNCWAELDWESFREVTPDMEVSLANWELLEECPACWAFDTY